MRLLSEKFPNIRSAKSEIINLEAILNLPKGTEHFLSDIHGEYETFKHVLSNGSGVIRRRIDDIFGDKITEIEKDKLAMLIYYPVAKLDKLELENSLSDDWYRQNLTYLVEIAAYISSKYTRSKIRKSLPKDMGYIIDELLNINKNLRNKETYFSSIIESIIHNQASNDFIYEITHLIQRLSIDRLHIVGDIFDRGPSPDKVMDEIMKTPSVDIQWGNHDVVWMGAAAGIEVYIALVIRISARYNNMAILEDSYGINLFSLYEFASEQYADDPCKSFKPKDSNKMSKKQTELLKKVHKAISIIQFKLEGQIIKRNPQFKMNDRLLLESINLKDKNVKIKNKFYELNDLNFPTIDPKTPYELTEEEKEIMNKLQKSFNSSEKLQKHINFLYSNGGMYLKYNNLLLYHGAIPITFKGNLKKIEINNKNYQGKSLMDKLDKMARQAYYDENAILAKDYLWYLWCGPDSPLFGKKKMATFERYFIDDLNVQKEDRKAYYDLRENEEVIDIILKEFGMNPAISKVVNGHVPVKVVKGESPIKAGSKLIVIDGGMSAPYQSVTGIAGFTLISNSYGLVIVSHQSFPSKKDAIETGQDMISSHQFLSEKKERKTVSQTDVGIKIKEQVKDLKNLVNAFKQGIIKEIYDK
ncbi:MAG: fructose-1,6-bisphosphatase [Bacteroidetes bacterium CG2_30_33_31]|nr:MAG: fructose-1,6-bisphosphatase [Bacteroidetes bacterium CG2_30_33_31]